jgi:branched-chain amino acid transport system ATP-binding protein
MSAGSIALTVAAGPGRCQRARAILPLTAVPPATTSPLLEIDRLTVRFGGLAALSDVSLTVARGEIVGLIGPNGAGKTTLFNVLSGLVRPTTGAVRFRSTPITRLPPFRIARLGVARTFQLVRILPALTVLQNVLVGMHFGAGAWTAGSRDLEARRLLERVGLAGHATQRAGTLPLADRKRLEIARALATRPALLLLDEVLSGIRATEARGLMELIREIRAAGTTVILIEHIMKAIMALSDRIVVLHHGEKIAEGSPAAVASDPAVIRAYLGTSSS